MQISISEGGEGLQGEHRIEPIAEYGGRGTQCFTQSDTAQAEERIDIQIVPRAGAALDSPDRGGRQVHHGGNLDPGRLGELRILHTPAHLAAGEGDAHDAAAIHDTREVVRAAADDLVVVQVRDPGEELKGVEGLR